MKVSDRLQPVHLNLEKSGRFSLASCSTISMGPPQAGQSGGPAVASG